MEQRAMMCWGVVVVFAASAFLGGCAKAPDQRVAEIQETPGTALAPKSGPEIETADFVMIFAGQAGKYFIYPNYGTDQTTWEIKPGVLIRFVNGTDLPVTVTALPADYFGVENSTFGIEKNHSEFKKVVGLPADDAELKITLTVQDDSGLPLVVTGGPKMVVTGADTSGPSG